MPRPLVLTDHLRELPVDAPLEIGAARTPSQALTPAQIVGGENVTVVWRDGELVISATGGGETEPLADRMARLGDLGFASGPAGLKGDTPSIDDSGIRVDGDLPPSGAAPVYAGLPDLDYAGTEQSLRGSTPSIQDSGVRVAVITPAARTPFPAHQLPALTGAASPEAFDGDLA